MTKKAALLGWMPSSTSRLIKPAQVALFGLTPLPTLHIVEPFHHIVYICARACPFTSFMSNIRKKQKERKRWGGIFRLQGFRPKRKGEGYSTLTSEFC